MLIFEQGINVFADCTRIFGFVAGRYNSYARILHEFSLRHELRESAPTNDEYATVA